MPIGPKINFVGEAPNRRHDRRLTVGKPARNDFSEHDNRVVTHQAGMVHVQCQQKKCDDGPNVRFDALAQGDLLMPSRSQPLLN